MRPGGSKAAATELAAAMGKKRHRKTQGSKRKKTRTHKPIDEEAFLKTPKCMVLPRRQVGLTVKALVEDWKKTLLPFCAVNIKLGKGAGLKELRPYMGHFGISHLWMFYSAPSGTTSTLSLVPHGPTVHFKVLSYMLAADVARQQRRHYRMLPQYLKNPPIIILNHFAGVNRPEIQTLATMLQGMVPQITVSTIKLSQCKRVLLFHRNPETDIIDVRMYLLIVRTAGRSRSVKKLTRNRKWKRLSQVEDVADLITQADAYASDSDAEAEVVDLPPEFDHKGDEGEKKMIKLIEMGPRMSLQIDKLKNGFLEGEVVYHHHVEKTPEELEKLRAITKSKDRQKS